MIEKIVRKTIKQHGLIEKGDCIILGLSGGPDSVCLFSVLQTLSRDLKLQIVAVHVNHKLRPGAADEDQKYVEDICKEAGITCKTVTVDCKAIAKAQGITSEEAGRNARYEAFYETAKELLEEEGVSAEKIKIAVAQNKNDQAETVLMRILRGTGTDGLAGIAYAREGAFGTTVIRPLLDVGREEILKYCNEHKLHPRMDHTNEQPVYTRNKIRLELLPYLKENFNENIIETLARMARVSREDKDYLGNAAKTSLEQLRITNHRCELNKQIVLDRVGLKALAPSIQNRVIKMALTEAGLSQGVAEAHLQGARYMINSGRASAAAEFPGEYEVHVSYNSIVIGKQQSEHGLQGESQLSEYKILRQMVADMEDIKGETTEGNMAFLDYDCFEKKQMETGLPLVLRTRQPGDFFVPKGMKKGRKKMQDYFVDQKIPQGQRDAFLLACLGNEVLWIADPDPASGKGGKINEHYGITQSTRRVLVLEIYEKL